MKGVRITVALAVVVAAPLVDFTVAFAQQTGGGASGGAAGAGGGAGAGGASAGGGTSTVTVPVITGPVAPTPAGQPLGGGNTGSTSSSLPKSGDEEDHFDLGPRGTGGGTAFGQENGPVFLDHGGRGGSGGGGIHLAGGQVPNTHVVRKGDTLWDICDFYFENPYQWPRVWSYNPQLDNPHWIYPGDQIRLKSNGVSINDAAGQGAGGPAAGADGAGGSSIVDRRRQVPNDTIFLRDQGFVAESSNEDWGEITGAPVDKMFLSDFDEVYVKVGGNHDVKLGQELTVFRPVRQVPGGELVQIQGTIKVDNWNAKDRIARGQIVETLDVIERGARIGPVGRRFVVAPPVRNQSDVKAKILASIHRHEFYGQNQVVFIDRGNKDGLVVGNRLFVIRKGDAWRKSLPASSSAATSRIALESDSPAETETIPSPHNSAELPEDVIGELRVVAIQEHSATCVVTQSKSEIEQDDTALARKGY